ncbi:MAG TPA: translation initiation factor IF-2 N-terminal domain-containing protein, partial [Clostridia bacterium]|nr:translation initiation factor IF-2 N-terminal domain-containing protein [Clostridia bacterium]
MMIKYRVHEVAKDFDLTSKDISGILKKYLDVSKKAQTALEDTELDIIFETLTQRFSVESFDEYFAMQKTDEQRATEKQSATDEKETKKAAGKKFKPTDTKDAKSAKSAPFK